MYMSAADGPSVINERKLCLQPLFKGWRSELEALSCDPESRLCLFTMASVAEILPEYIHTPRLTRERYKSSAEQIDGELRHIGARL
jgi:hypothetical protein